jgi:hypothetical protein
MIKTDTFVQMVTTTEQQIEPVVEIDCDELIGVFTNFLQFDVANGGASGDTIVTYWTQVKQYLEGISPARSQLN